jgi:hypothetical protein
VGESTEESAPRRRVGYVSGRWQVTYLSPGEPGRDADVRRGLLVGPLVSDVSRTLWVAVLPDGGKRRTMIRRDWITSIAPPRPAERLSPRGCR